MSPLTIIVIIIVVIIVIIIVLDQVARKWAMSVNYDKTIGVVVTPPTAATQGDQPASAVITTAPPGIQVGPNRVEI